MARKSKLLNELGEKLNNKIGDVSNVEELPIPFLLELKEEIRVNVIDYRADVAYQPLENVVMITFIAILSNCDEWTQIHEFGIIHHEWFARFLDLKYSIPSLSTIRKTFGLIDPSELENILVKIILKKVEELSEIFKSLNTTEDEQQAENQEVEETKDILAYDGKVCRGSKRNNTVNGEIKPVNAMSVHNVTKDITLATKFMDEKTNEIPTGPELIKLLDLTNTISTFDALNTQKKTIEAIVGKGGDYVGALKGNQHNFYNDVVDYFDDHGLYQEAYDKSHYEESEKAHGTLEKRTYVMTENISWLNTEEWKGLKAIGLCTREYEENGLPKKDIRYFITSLGIEEIKDFARAVRDEWGIENNLHWHLDVTFKEDTNRTMNKNAQANLNILRKLALNILKLIKPIYNKSLKLIRFRLGQNFEDEIARVFFYLNIEELAKLVQKTQ